MCCFYYYKEENKAASMSASCKTMMDFECPVPRRARDKGFMDENKPEVHIG